MTSVALGVDARSGQVALGSVTPRIWTPPLVTGPPGPCGCGCALTDDTSFGFDLVRFAAVIGWPLDPWQRWAAIHLGELLPDGTPRFRYLLIIVARQNGKTVLSRVLILYWMYVDQAPLVIGTSADRKKAKESWTNVIKIATKVPRLRRELPKVYRRDTTGEEDFWTTHPEEECTRGPGCDHEAHYQFAAPNKNAGRGNTVHRALVDELRQHETFECWAALTNAMNAVGDAQLVAITNMGGSRSVVLHNLRNNALRYINEGIGDPSYGLFEWSAPPGSDPEDLTALAMANPDLGNRIKPRVLLGQAIAAKAAGGEELAEFETEVMCIAPSFDAGPGIDDARWRNCQDPNPVDLAQHRSRLAVCIEVSIAGDHATLAGAALLDDGRVHAGVIATWVDLAELRRDLPALIERIRPRALAWFPTGPTAQVVAAVKAPPGRRWPPRGVQLKEIGGETAAVCMGLNEQIASGDLRVRPDELLDRQVEHTTRQPRGDGAYVFSRRGSGPIDAVYALAGAVHIARTLPPPPPPLKVI